MVSVFGGVGCGFAGKRGGVRGEPVSEEVRGPVTGQDCGAFGGYRARAAFAGALSGVPGSA